MVSCLMGDSTALASAIVRCCLKSTLHKERALRSVDLTKQTITLVIRIIAAFCDGYVKKQFANMNKM